ncbi:hypothetical protein NHX12_007405, partial [Muraenolepis orangiensis]
GPSEDGFQSLDGEGLGQPAVTPLTPAETVHLADRGPSWLQTSSSLAGPGVFLCAGEGTAGGPRGAARRSDKPRLRHRLPKADTVKVLTDSNTNKQRDGPELPELAFLISQSDSR